MGLFNFNKKEKDKNKKLREDNKRLKRQLQDNEIKIGFLEKRLNEKDEYFKEMISDGLRHGSKLASKHMKDRKDYLNRKK